MSETRKITYLDHAIFTHRGDYECYLTESLRKDPYLSNLLEPLGEEAKKAEMPYCGGQLLKEFKRILPRSSKFGKFSVYARSESAVDRVDRRGFIRGFIYSNLVLVPAELKIPIEKIPFISYEEFESKTRSAMDKHNPVLPKLEVEASD